MKKTLLAISIFIIATLSITACEFGTPSKITLDEFNQIENGMSYSEVVEIIGGNGEMMSEFESAKMYTWEGSGSIGANANVSFMDGEVTGKAQFGLK